MTELFVTSQQGSQNWKQLIGNALIDVTVYQYIDAMYRALILRQLTPTSRAAVQPMSCQRCLEVVHEMMSSHILLQDVSQFLNTKYSE